MKIKKRIILLLSMMLMAACFFCVPVKPKAAEGTRYIQTVSYDGKTGEEHVDGAIERGDKFLNGLVKFLGIAVGVVGLVFGLIGWLGHQDDMKARAPITIIVGVGIYFAPEIFKYFIGA